MIGQRAARLVEGDVVADTGAYTYGGAYGEADLKGVSQFCVRMKSNPLCGPSQPNSYAQAKQNTSARSELKSYAQVNPLRGPSSTATRRHPHGPHLPGTEDSRAGRKQMPENFHGSTRRM